MVGSSNDRKGLSMRYASSNRSRLGRILFAILAMGSLASTPEVSAQGTSGTFPDPISTRELEKYAAKLTMSTQQQQGIGLPHDEYLESFRALREGPIEEYLHEYGAGSGFNFFSGDADLKKLEKGVKKRNELMDRIRTLDNRFFDQVQTVLTEDQIAGMTRVKQARERLRYRSGFSRMSMFSSPGVRVDLSELVGELDLTVQILEIVDPIVAQYERNLTAELRNLYKGASTMQLDLQKRLQEQGFEPPTRGGDRRQRGQRFQIIQESFRAMNERIAELSAEIHKLNRRSARQFARLLPPKAARDLKMRYYDLAYPAIPVGRGGAGRRLDEIERMKDIPDDQREQIASLETAFLTSLDSLVKQMVAVSEKIGPSVFEFRFNEDDTGEPDENQVKMQRLREQRTAMIDRTVNDINLILGEEFRKQLDRRIAAVEESEGEESGTVEIMAFAIDGGGGGGGMQTMILRASGSFDMATDEQEDDTTDLYLPGAITNRELDRYAKYLGVDDDMRSVLDGMYEDYLAKFDQLHELRIEPVKAKSRSLWGFDEKTGEVNSPGRKDIEELYRLRRIALHDIGELENSFFSDLESVLLDDTRAQAMQRVRLARKRSIYSRGRDTGGFRMFGTPGRGPGSGGHRAMSFISLGSGTSSESLTDISRLIDELQFESEDLASIDPIMAEYERDMTGQFQIAFETSLRFNEAMEAMQAEATTVSEDGNRREVRMRGGGGMRDLMQGDGQLQQETRRAIVELNRETLDDLERLLPSETMNLLRDTYNRRSFPDIYNDSLSAEPLLRGVYNLQNLDPNQRMKTDEISMNYRSAYEALCQQMVEMKIRSPVGGMSGGGFGGGRRGNFDFQAMQQRQRDMERIRFERKDLSDKTRNNLRAVLTETQQERLSALFQPKEQGAILRIGG